jgi:hypothetical protein
VAARAAGESVGAIAEAAGISTSRTNELLDGAAAKPEGLPLEEIEYLLEHAFDVVLVPAAQLAITITRISRSMCAGGRTFRDCALDRVNR